MTGSSNKMRTNFTPTTERVRDRFITHSGMTHSSIGGPAEYAAAFDRWLASVTTPVVTTVSTEAEYAALPIGTVVRGNQRGQVAERVDDDVEDGGYRWVYTGEAQGSFEHKTIVRNLGEATVLFTPPAAHS